MASVGSLKIEDLAALAILVAVAIGAALAGFVAALYWFRHNDRREFFKAGPAAGREAEGIFLTGNDAAVHGELIAQFKVNQGRQVVSILESDGKRFIHVDGELSAKERAKMIHYLKSEGFVS